MAIFSRLFASRTGDPYAEGIALFEQGRHAEAAARLRAAGGLDDDSPRGSLAAFYLRKALVAEGRRLVAAGEPARAVADLREAARAWPEYPDVQFLAGAAAGLAGDWAAGLGGARDALRQNHDYPEARLLEACALRELGRTREAAEALNALVECGRRMSHRLIDTLARDGGYGPDDLPDDLPAQLVAAVGGGGVKDRLAEAIAHCQAGAWDEGLAQLARLSEDQPRFPDIRAKYAAALFQVGRLDDALAQVDAALALRPQYRTGVLLRGLVLADLGRLADARQHLATQLPGERGAAGRHEELFVAYLRGVLAFLIGDLDEARALLGDWDDLPAQFARATLLLAACDALDDLPDRATARLEALVSAWPADAELAFFLAAQYLAHGRLERAEHVLAHWPGGAPLTGDLRPHLLRNRLALARGRPPDLPDPLPPAQAPDQPRPAAWRQLAAARALHDGRAAEAREICDALFAAGTADEETGRLWLAAAAADAGSAPALACPDSWVAPSGWRLRRGGLAREAERLIACRRAVRPDDPRWWWLGADFWLAPVRRWLS